DVEPAERRDRVVDHRPDVGFACDVDVHEAGASGLGLDLADGLPAGPVVEVRHADGCPFPGEPQRGGAADPGPRPRHERDTTRDFHGLSMAEAYDSERAGEPRHRVLAAE